jgi:enamine deaminase RidA (YjgF/YER057c/UK114 family)
MKFEERLKELGITLPAVVTPMASYTPAVVSGAYVFVSGQLPLVEGKLKFTGRVGREVSIDEANECARIAVLNCLAAIRNVVGSLDKIKRIVRITGYVRGGEDFNDHPRVLNGASDLLVEIFGDAGVHTRSAVGSSGLPLGAPVEVEMIVEVEA